MSTVKQIATQSLHLYFDTAAKSNPAVMTFPFRIDISGSFYGARTQPNHRLLHYSVCSLASLHYSFSHIQLAKHTFIEAIGIAQSHADHECVAYALAWLYYIQGMEASSEDTSYYMGCTKASLKRALDLNMMKLISSNCLSCASSLVFREPVISANRSRTALSDGYDTSCPWDPFGARSYWAQKIMLVQDYLSLASSPNKASTITTSSLTGSFTGRHNAAGSRRYLQQNSPHRIQQHPGQLSSHAFGGGNPEDHLSPVKQQQRGRKHDEKNFFF